MSQDYGSLFQDWEIAIAKKLVNEYQKKWACLKKEEFNDLLQECLTHWFYVKSKYNPKREASRKTFMGKIIRNKLMDLVREKDTDKRKISEHTISYDQPMGNDDDAPALIDNIGILTDIDTSPDPHLKILLKIDISNVLNKLSPEHRELCTLFGEKGLTITEVSEYLNTPRSTIYDELKRIRKFFQKEELDK